MKHSKYACKYSHNNRIADETGSAVFDQGTLLSRSNDMNPNSYVNTPSSSSTASSSTPKRSLQYRRASKSVTVASNVISYRLTTGDWYERHSNGRRHRCDRLLHQTHLLNRQYIIKMTSVLSRMQKQMDKLNRRTVHLETTLSRQIKSGLPIIRIPRLTRGRSRRTKAATYEALSSSLCADEIFCVTADDDDRPSNDFSDRERETEDYKFCFSPSTNDNECRGKDALIVPSLFNPVIRSRQAGEGRTYRKYRRQ